MLHAVVCYAAAVVVGSVAPRRHIVTILEETNGKRKRSFLGYLKMEQYSYLENGFEGKNRTIFFANQFEKNHTNKIFFCRTKANKWTHVFSGNQGIERCLVLPSRSGLSCVCFVSRYAVACWCRLCSVLESGQP